MSRFHHLWIVEAELEVGNPEPDREPCAGRLFAALERHASDETSPYPTQAARSDDGWVEITFPVWSATRLAALAAGATVLAEACAVARVEVGTVRLTAGESSDELTRYRDRTRDLEAGLSD